MESIVTGPDRSALTYKWDRLRGAGQGIVETCWQVFALLVAIRFFEADESVKQFIPAGLGLGFLLAPLGLGLASRLQARISSLIGILWVGVALAIGGMILSSGTVAFVACVAMAQILSSQAVPLLTHLYSANYAGSQRGSRLSTTFLIGSFAGIIAGFVGGEVLDLNVALYPWLFGAGIAAALLSAGAAARIPSEPATSLHSRNPLESLSLIWKDPLFGWMLLAWMFMGIGNLMLIPLRVEYLANPAYGINATNTQISGLLISTVLAFRLLSTKIWGFLFDRVNVVTLRVSLNMVFSASICCFFFTDQLWLIGVGCALLGMAFGGGGILWTLYVTKIAPPDKIASYMSVHSFTTGLRMAAAPFIGYAILSFAHPAFAAWLALLFIGLSTLIFIPLKPRIDAKAAHLDRPPDPPLDASRPNPA